jgi:hypothetical protein
MTRGKPPKGGVFGSRVDATKREVKIIRIERKEIHGQMVDVKICEPGSSSNPIAIEDIKRPKSNAFFEPQRFSLGPMSSGLHGTTQHLSFTVKKTKPIDEDETDG